MPQLDEIKRSCKITLASLVNRGSEVCSEFDAKVGMSYFCDKCGYSQYIHLCKQISEIEESK